MWYCLAGLVFYLLLTTYLKLQASKYGTREINRSKHRLLTIILILFGVFGVCYSDYWEYRALVHQAYDTYQEYGGAAGFLYIHMEPIYNYLAAWCQGNYILWRTVLFSVEFIGLTYCFKQTGLNNYQSYSVFSFLVLESICPGRVSWGVTFFWMGLYSYLLTGKKRFIIFIILSAFAHNSMFLLLALLPCLFIRINKFTVIIVLLLTPIAAYYLADVFNNRDSLISMSGYGGYLEFIGNRLENSTKTEENVNFWGNSISEMIINTVYRLPLYYLLFKMFFDYLSKRLSFPGNTERIMSVIFFLFIYTFVALFGGINSAAMYARFFIMLYLPVFLVTYGLNRNYYYKKKSYQICCFLIYLAYILLYLSETRIYYYHGIVTRLDM